MRAKSVRERGKRPRCRVAHASYSNGRIYVKLELMDDKTDKDSLPPIHGAPASCPSRAIRKGRLGVDDFKAEDYAYWRSQPADILFAAAWDIVLQTWHLLERDPDELRFQRSVVRLSRREG